MFSPPRVLPNTTQETPEFGSSPWSQSLSTSKNQPDDEREE
jgi:hypothetical protein